MFVVDPNADPLLRRAYRQKHSAEKLVAKRVANLVPRGWRPGPTILIHSARLEAR